MRETITVTQARKIIAEHGFRSYVETQSSEAEALYVEIPWSRSTGVDTWESGIFHSHVSDFTPDHPTVRLDLVREVLGY